MQTPINKRNQLKADIKKLKVLLIVLTITQVSHLFIFFFAIRLWSKLDQNYHLNMIMWFFNAIVSGIFIWYNWKYLPIEKKKKYNNTWMILFLGIIGMWLWMPNEKEIHQMMNDKEKL